MSEEPKTRFAKYEGGCLIAVIVVFGLVFLAGLLNPKKKPVDVRVIGQIQGHFIDDPTFTLAIWHQHEGNLKNGRLTVHLHRKSVRPEDAAHVHSFETWSPNKQNAVTKSISLPNYDPAEPLVVEVFVKAANARDTLIRLVWHNGAWKD
ncbi:MAG: hypothetical protein O3C40_35695 [Planctomycetota bacterium]|nr:hypothetical protein [Planctomycetota bacterium]